MSTIHSTTFKNDGYCDGIKANDPSPPDIGVYAREYMEGYHNARLDYLREEINAERISYGELIELQNLIPYIDSSDVQLLEWAGVEEVIL